MQRARYQLFAGARFAKDTDTRITRRHPLDLRHQPLHLFASPNHLMPAQLVTKLLVLLFQSPQAQRILHRQQQLVGRDWLFQEIKRAQLGGFHRHGDMCLARHHHHRGAQPQRAILFQKLQSVFSGHHYVRKNQIVTFGFHQFQCLLGALTNGGFVSCKSKGARQRCQGIGVIVNDEQMGLALHGRRAPFFGSRMTNVVPFCSSLCAQILPP